MENKKKVIAFIQARAESERFPKKIFYKINNLSLIEILIKRLKKSKYIKKIVILSYKSDLNKKLIPIVKKNNCEIFFGSKENVLRRFFFASKKYRDFYQILRITGDCTLSDSKLIDDMILYHTKANYDFTSNVNPPTFPDGFDVEIFTKKLLIKTYKKVTSKFDQEHVTPWMKKNKKIRISNYSQPYDFSKYKISVDEFEDYKKIKYLIKDNNNNIFVNKMKIYKFLKKNYKKYKDHLNYNEGSKLSSGQKMWIRSQKIIAGGNMFFSKNPDNFLPKLWPSYFSKSKKCFVWDLSNKKYTDFCLMGVGTNILGYANLKVDKKVSEAINKGNMSTLNCPEEVEFSEKLLTINPWADKVKLARTGGELNSMAIRIARAATNKTKIAISGYHGWHDWYLAANLKNKNNLDNHLFKGLKAKGIPNELKNTVFTFENNNYEQILRLSQKHNLAAIKLEVTRNNDTNIKFIKKLRKLADKKKIVLIFDECTSGFRETFGGIHKKFGVDPDIALFGKSIGNGYPITALVGKDNVMDCCKDTFISSTFWSDRIGPTAGLATLNEMERLKSWKKISNTGEKIKKVWKKIAYNHKLDITIQGISSLPNFYFKNRNNLIYKSYITQEMLKKNILSTLAIYVCIDHTDDLLKKYYDNLNDIFYKISKNNTNDQLIKSLDQIVLNDFKKRNIL